MCYPGEGFPGMSCGSLPDIAAVRTGTRLAVITAGGGQTFNPDIGKQFNLLRERLLPISIVGSNR